MTASNETAATHGERTLPIRDGHRPVPEPETLKTPAEDHTGSGSKTLPSSTDGSMPALTPTPFGRAMREAHFRIAPGHLPLNHGSYGLPPLYVHAALEKQSAVADARPDHWMRFSMPAAVRRSRAQVAALLGVADASSVVLVPNTTTATETVLHNLAWAEGDVVLYYSACYAALEKALVWTAERGGAVERERIDVAWPVSDDALVGAFEAAIARINGARDGRRVRLLVFDTIVSQPGVRVPWERLCGVARAAGALSLVDGAHGIGMIPLDLAAADPDFFASNLHKWLHVPRGCAAFYVAPRVQHLIRATMPISHGFRPLPAAAAAGGAAADHPIHNPLFGRSYGALPDLFAWVATIDYQPYAVVDAALRWREHVCGGEAAIMRYCIDVAQRGADEAARILGTEVMGREGSCARDCALANVLVPIAVCGDVRQQPPPPPPPPAHWAVVEAADAPKVTEFLQLGSARLCDGYFHNIRLGDRWWWRLSGQVYVELADCQAAARGMLQLVDHVKRGVWLDEVEKWLDEE